MLHPSYSELLNTLNKVNAKKGYDELGSRYGLVIAVSRRARALQDGEPATVYAKSNERKLSVAIAEMQLGNLAVCPKEPENEMFDVANLGDGISLNNGESYSEEQN